MVVHPKDDLVLELHMIGRGFTGEVVAGGDRGEDQAGATGELSPVG